MLDRTQRSVGIMKGIYGACQLIDYIDIGATRVEADMPGAGARRHVHCRIPGYSERKSGGPGMETVYRNFVHTQVGSQQIPLVGREHRRMHMGLFLTGCIGACAGMLYELAQRAYRSVGTDGQRG